MQWGFLIDKIRKSILVTGILHSVLCILNNDVILKKSAFANRICEFEKTYRTLLILFFTVSCFVFNTFEIDV